MKHDPTPPPDFEDVDTPRIEIAHGLLDAKHRRQLGPAWHLYLYLLSRKPFRSPFVARGRAIPIWILAWVEGVDRDEDGRPLKDHGDSVIRRWLARLRKYSYITTEAVNTGDRKTSGVRVRILKAKEWKAGRMRVFKDHPRAESPGGPRTKSPGGSDAQGSGA